MANIIKHSDIAEVKARVNIADVVSDYVALKPAGVDRLKGLCPFHDERTASFHVQPSKGMFHCFGCGEGGDVISFVQQLDHLTFTETVERLATKIGYELTYEDTPSRAPTGPSRPRLFAAHSEAVTFYQMQLSQEEAVQARNTLLGRGFDEESWKQFAIGYAPRGWEGLKQYLIGKGFSEQELLAAGLLSQGNRGTYDRFRGRIMWPINDTSGQTVGFGARKLYEDDPGPKYLNTPETAIYHKARVLYGLDHAKKSIAKHRRTIVVEGYTDVMACHLAGITEAVATCGTAFGQEHITLLRRVMGDDPSAEVIFTFDPDEAGQKAALKAFAEQERFSAQTYIAIAPAGYDPSDLRQHRGDEALKEMFAGKKPLFAFALSQELARFDLNTVEGRSLALRAAAPIVQGIRDPQVKQGYARELSLMLGMEVSEIEAAMGRNRAHQPERAERAQTTPGTEETARLTLNSLPQTPVLRTERDALMVMLQQPEQVGTDLLTQAVAVQFHAPAFEAVAKAVETHIAQLGATNWLELVLDSTPVEFQHLCRELALTPLPYRSVNTLSFYATSVVKALIEHDLLSLKHEMLSRLQRMPDPGDPMYRSMQEQVRMLEQARRALQLE